MNFKFLLVSLDIVVAWCVAFNMLEVGVTRCADFSTWDLSEEYIGDNTWVSEEYIGDRLVSVVT